MDDSPFASASLEASEDITGWVARIRPRLILRCVEDQTELLVYAGVSPQPELGNYAQASVRLRFDGARPVSDAWLQSASGNALFAGDPMALVGPLQRAHRFLFEFTPIGAGPVVIEFDVTGLDQVVGKVATTCHWEEKAHARAVKTAKEQAERNAEAARRDAADKARGRSEQEAAAASAKLELEAKLAKAAFDSVWARAYRLNDVNVPPKLLTGDGPIPLQGGAFGRPVVDASFVVGEDGAVTVVQTDASAQVDRIVRAAIKARRYSPAQRDGKPVSVRMHQLITTM